MPRNDSLAHPRSTTREPQEQGGSSDFHAQCQIRVLQPPGPTRTPSLSTTPMLVYAQPIISKARPDLLKSHFIPTLEKLKKKAIKIVMEEEQLKADNKTDTQEAELLILDEFAVLCRDLYAFYPMLIRYVDNNR
ncbi:UNVERIFIED_CONTAM: Ryanodine receptor 3 [Gekko kuhli]